MGSSGSESSGDVPADCGGVGVSRGTSRRLDEDRALLAARDRARERSSGGSSESESPPVPSSPVPGSEGLAAVTEPVTEPVVSGSSGFPERAFKRGRVPREELPEEKLAFLEWFERAVAENERFLDDAYRRYDGWRSRLWVFTHRMRRYPGAIEGGCIPMLARVDALITKYLGRAWGDVFPVRFKGDIQMCDEDFRAQFSKSWELMERRRQEGGGKGVVTVALEKAGAHPVDVDAEFPEYANIRAGFRRFVSFARWLQDAAGEGESITLPVYQLSRLFDVMPCTISSYRRKAVEEGWLTVVKEFRFRTRRSDSRATEFVFNLSKVSGVPGANPQNPREEREETETTS